MEGDAERTVRFRNELASALSEGQFELYYQPHLNLQNGERFGCEALIRWRHPERGLLLPGVFIPPAERLGLIEGIDTWVMREALRAAHEFERRGQRMRVYFNLSGRHAGDPKVIETLKRAAADGLSLGNLGIEITETDAMRDFEATRAVCVAARELGVRVALDDFGTGYSSLTALRRLPVDLVKIDRSSSPAFSMIVTTRRWSRRSFRWRASSAATCSPKASNERTRSIGYAGASARSYKGTRSRIRFQSTRSIPG